MNRDLFLAILAMGSYNRGYGQGVSKLTPSGQIGLATIAKDSLVLGGNTDERLDEAAGFYAIAYDMTGVAGFVSGERGMS